MLMLLGVFATWQWLSHLLNRQLGTLLCKTARLEFAGRKVELEFALFEHQVGVEKAARLVAAEALDEGGLLAVEEVLDFFRRDFLAE